MTKGHTHDPLDRRIHRSIARNSVGRASEIDGFRLPVALSILLLTTTCQAAFSRATYPAQIRGTWEPGPYPCQLPLEYDSDAGFEIKQSILLGYEHQNKPTYIQKISSAPEAWRIESIEEYGGKLSREVEIFVLDKDSMTITDGDSAETYNRCKKRPS